MRPRRMRFTIRSLMIAIVLMAFLLALPTAAVIAVVALCFPCTCFIGAAWLVFRGHRRVAALAFLGLAISANVLFAAACITPDIYTRIPLFYVWLFMAMPAILVIGPAWCRLAWIPTQLFWANNLGPLTPVFPGSTCF